MHKQNKFMQKILNVFFRLKTLVRIAFLPTHKCKSEQNSPFTEF